MDEQRFPPAGPEERAEWTHGHGASPVDPDPELSVRGILWTAIGIGAVTAVAMVLMVLMAGGLGDWLVEREPPPTPAEAERREQVRRAGEERRAAERVPRPELSLPAEYEVPPEPRLELNATFNLKGLREEEDRLLGEWAWADEESGRVRMPIATAIELAAEGRLPGVPRGAAAAAGEAASGAAGETAGPGAAAPADDATRAGRSPAGAGEAEVGAPAEVHGREEPPQDAPREDQR